VGTKVGASKGSAVGRAVGSVDTTTEGLPEGCLRRAAGEFTGDPFSRVPVNVGEEDVETRGDFDGLFEGVLEGESFGTPDGLSVDAFILLGARVGVNVGSIIGIDAGIVNIGERTGGRTGGFVAGPSFVGVCTGITTGGGACTGMLISSLRRSKNSAKSSVVFCEYKTGPGPGTFSDRRREFRWAAIGTNVSTGHIQNVTFIAIYFTSMIRRLFPNPRVPVVKLQNETLTKFE